MRPDLYCDLETYSTVPINCGTHAYAEGAEVLLWLYAIGDGEVKCWDVTSDEPVPDDLRDNLDDPDVTTVWHNGGMFDGVVLAHALGVNIPIERVHDTLVQALAHSLPASLAALCDVLKVDAGDAKDKNGKRLIQLFCKPQKFTHRLERDKDGGETVAQFKERVALAKSQWVGRATRETHPVEWAEFIEYGKADIRAMRECKKRMPNWNYKGAELELWHLDQRINRRGMYMDMDLVRGALAAVAQEQIALAERTAVMTSGEVESTTQRNRMMDYITSQYGIVLDDLQMSTVERMLEDPDTAPGLRALLEVRLQASTTSTSKYATIMRAVSRDGRLRGTMQFDGASRTGRVGHRLMQPGNMPRPVLKQPAIARGIGYLKAGCADLVVDNVMQLTSSAIRATITSPPGRKLCVADLSNIEGRDQCWLAGEEWKLDAFRAFDTLTGEFDAKGKPLRAGPDLYKLAYGKSFGIAPEDVNDDQRQVGKVMELACGYAGGVGAFATFAMAYGIDLDDFAERVIPEAPDWAVEESTSYLDYLVKKKKGNEYGISDDAFIACDTVKRVWRHAHPAISSYWKELEETVIAAIQNPGFTLPCRKVKIRRDGAWLRIGLPSGRALCYPSPEVDKDGKITHMGMHQMSRKWVRLTTYGGKLFENCIAAGTPVLTDAGWMPIERVTTSHQVWDGEQWVAHKGLAAKGVQPVVEVFGVALTPDHKILTTKGWKNASSCEGHYRAPSGLPDSAEIRRGRGGRPAVDVAHAMRLRQSGVTWRVGIIETETTGGSGVVRLQAQRDNGYAQNESRDVAPPGLRGVARAAGSLLTAHTPSMGQLRRARYSGLRTVARVVREFLGRHGADVSAGPGHRPRGQQRALHTGQLPLGDPQGEHAQHADQPHSPGGYAGATGGRIRHRSVYPGVSTSQRGDGAGVVCDTGRYEQVYDLLDCGPRSRFVVLGADGLPLIVHNCCQAVARDVMFYNMPGVEANGYEIILSIHDELLTETPDTPDYNADGLSNLLAANPVWARDMPLAAAGFETKAYRKG